MDAKSPLIVPGGDCLGSVFPIIFLTISIAWGPLITIATTGDSFMKLFNESWINFPYSLWSENANFLPSLSAEPFALLKTDLI